MLISSTKLSKECSFLPLRKPIQNLKNSKKLPAKALAAILSRPTCLLSPRCGLLSFSIQDTWCLNLLISKLRAAPIKTKIRKVFSVFRQLRPSTTLPLITLVLKLMKSLAPTNPLKLSRKLERPKTRSRRRKKKKKFRPTILCSQMEAGNAASAKTTISRVAESVIDATKLRATKIKKESQSICWDPKPRRFKRARFRKTTEFRKTQVHALATGFARDAATTTSRSDKCATCATWVKPTATACCSRLSASKTCSTTQHSQLASHCKWQLRLYLPPSIELECKQQIKICKNLK